MKKTTGITVGLVLSSLILWGCSEERRCIDDEGIVVSDENCQESESSSRSHRHHWYYGGYGYRVGEKATGGSNVSRGGFGKFASFHTSGGS